MLSSPLIAIGYTEGGRLISWIAAVLAVAVTIRLVQHWIGDETALLSGTFLWFVPLFLLSSFSFMTESLSILLTTASVLCAVRAVDSKHNYWVIGCGIFLVLGVLTHLWEAIILLPVVIVFARAGRWRTAIIMGVVTICTVAVSFLLTHLQPRGGSSLSSYSAFGGNNWQYLIDLNWWLPPVGLLDTGSRAASFGVSPLRAVSKLMLLYAVFMLLYWGYQSRREDDYSVVMFAWVLAGLSIPIALPRGFLAHYYYTWGLIVPIAITTAKVTKKFIDSSPSITLTQLSTLAVTISLLLPLVLTPVVPFVIGHETSITPAPGIQLVEPSDQALDRAEELKQYDLQSTDGIVFIEESVEVSDNEWSGSFPAYVLIYANLMITERTFDKPGGVSIVDSPPEDCTVIVYRDRVKTCTDTGNKSFESDYQGASVPFQVYG
jgi:4-amino-4-deoxy-L-arabinose transferase-like glycosyltransferase